MQTSLVLTVIGRDRPGLVSALSQRITAHEGNWHDSRMASLAGQFAGLLLVSVPDERAQSLIASLRELEAQGLRLLFEHGAASAIEGGKKMTLDLTGQDRPGIVRDISEALAKHEVSIEEMETASFSASFSGEALFEMKATLHAPANVAETTLRRAVEALATDLMVEIRSGDER